MATITPATLDNWFVFHPATAEQHEQRERIRAAARVLAGVILAETPLSADQTAAFRLLRYAVAAAHDAIACGGK